MNCLSEAEPMVPYYERDDAFIYCGDNCDALTAMCKSSVDLVVTSPPYDDERTYGGHSWDFYGVAWQLKRVLKPGGVIVWIVGDATKKGNETGSSFRQALYFREIGLNLHDTMIYAKQGNAFPRHGHTKYPGAWEFMFVFTKGTPKTWNPIHDKPNLRAGQVMSGTVRQENGQRKPSRAAGKAVAEFGCRSNVWTYDVGYMKSTPDKIAYEHPAIFPEALAHDHIVTWTNEGDLVLDCFNGSGTTTKIASRLGRVAVGIDANESYCKIAAERLRADSFELLPAALDTSAAKS